MLNLSDLSAMVAVVNEGTLQAAAEKLHKTQPAISQAIKRVESAVNLKIFDRSGYRFILTDSGKAFFESAQELLTKAMQTEQFAKQLASGQEESYRICAHSIIPDDFYFAPIRKLAALYPQTHIYTVTDSFNGPLFQLQADQVDMAIVCGSTSSPVLQQYQSHHLGMLETINVIHPSLITAAPEPELMDGWLMNQRRIVVATSTQSDPYDYRIKPNGLFWSVGDGATQINLIRQGQGWGQVAKSVVQAELLRGELVELPVTRICRAADMHVWALRKPVRDVGQVGTDMWRLILEHVMHSGSDNS